MAVDIKTIIEILTKLANDVRNMYHIVKVFLFGSYAKGTPTEYSDIDVCFFIAYEENANWLAIGANILGLSNKYTDVDISPIVMHVTDLDGDDPFAEEVLITGIEIQ
jgi:predicted nucleotidyltransferase